MIRIKKLLISNFKGIENKLIIDFSKNGNVNHIFSGPNGYGKTTIFEALELCITGNFERVKTFENIQFKNKSRNKPFFQNNNKRDVVLKLLVENNDKYYTITKYYDHENLPSKVDSSKKFLPIDAHNIFTTYLDEGKEKFEDEIKGKELIEQEEIDRLFNEDKEITQKSIYYLFNYIQQEDNIRFLKLREDSKGESLSFLFNIDKEVESQIKITELTDKFRKSKKELEGQIETIKNFSLDSKNSNYNRVFTENVFEFDKEHPFEGLYEDIENAKYKYQDFIETIDVIIEFKQKFKPKEYRNYQIFNHINDNILRNKELLNSILINKLYNSEILESLLNKNNRISTYKRILALEDDDFGPENSREEFFKEEELDSYNRTVKSIESIDRDLNRIDKIISNLISYNKKVWENFREMKEETALKDNTCPLCASPFQDFDSLSSSYQNQLEYLTSFNQKKIESKQKLLREIKAFNEIVKREIEKFLQKNKKTEGPILSILRNYTNFKKTVEKIVKKHLTEENGLPEDILLNKMPNSLDELDKPRKELISFIESVVLPNYFYQTEHINNKELFIEYFKSKEELFNSIDVDELEKKKSYIKYKFSLLTNNRITILKSKYRKIEKIHERLEAINNNMSRVINTHKTEMIEKIKIPFFIYSGKILQNYQQGFGVFIEIKPTKQKNNVVFKTGMDSDHDVVYHLSSGQMAVVSLAFCLSLNKVYNTNEKFKFLAIDDPIQTLDNLNVHSFIELLRNEFSKYQIVLSTHNDFIARYISYKFEKSGMKATIQNVQDLVLEQTLN